MPPIRLGMKNTVRKTLVPRMFRVRASATEKASTLMSTVDTAAKATVNQKAWENVSSLRART
jgi:hypothetical protein